MADNRKLSVVDEDGKIIREDTRVNIHKKGLLHRESHVWFYTPKGEIIFQHRAKNKDTYPDLLDATVGGHVETGMDYEATALKEMEEETGVRVKKDQFAFLRMVKEKTYDPVTRMTNNVLRAVYAYRFEGNPRNLKIEEGKAIGFEKWPLEKIFNISEENKKLFIPNIFAEDTLEIFRKIQKLR